MNNYVIDKMSGGMVLKPNNSINKTRNAILRMKNCSPKLRTVLRQRCQERIQNERSKILNAIRSRTSQDRFRVAFGSIIKEEWKKIEDDDLCDITKENLPPDLQTQQFNLDEELLFEELLEKELLVEHEEWLFQQYEELMNEEFENYNNVVCPLCCSGFLEEKEWMSQKKVICKKCMKIFNIDKSLPDLQRAIYKSLAMHDKECSNNPSFINIPKSESENNLCLICDKCLILNVIA